jgi:KipI family sensor histidine kinase inhibitor
MTRSIPDGEVRPLGDRAFLIGVADPAAGRALARELGARLGHAGGVEVVCGFATVMVSLVDLNVEPGAVLAVAEDVLAHATPLRTGEGVGGRRLEVTVPCAFDGPDLDAVAGGARCSPDEVVALLTETALTVAVVGFSPGFAYLDGLSDPLRTVPRHDRPRPVVPAGSVALAGGHAAVYPTASPGGWQLVGRTGFPLFSPHRPPYAVLTPGDQVRFTVAGDGDPLDPAPVRALGWSPPAEARCVLELVAPGLRAVVQDGGRRSVAGAGVPQAGPADGVSFALANRLVGNAAGSGTLELTGGGARLRCLAACHVAAVGAAPRIHLAGTSVQAGQVLPLVRGQDLEVGPLTRGCRTYLSVAGGFVGPEIFASSATDELTGLGAGPLGRGARLHAGPWTPPLGDHVVAGAATEVQGGGVPVELHVVPGPHAERFEPDALATLGETDFRVMAQSNRVGIRLRAEGRAANLRSQAGGTGELDSQGVVTGAVQVPPHEDPVVLMPDHATLGGYPVLAVVASADHGRLGQCAPGTIVRFVPVDLAAARAAAGASQRTLERAVVGHYPLAVD